ncbi:HTH-type transcriptional regulator, bacterioopsin transcriptional activator and related proteins [Nitratiruptor sp. YY08-26]|uniref:PAS domain-containing protein n=1 Tax=unclassified Nitratiruptor TaxID=2624044 RepID=UPI0019166108|nr:MULTISPECIES: PAS domain S-box protein [unclassified Nitratiruptor]BCD62817.1 HTH-type transcriptional regulator, bacterioopsin transcriptional activator and related proteins [Nitratiruptor sp. YY08-13]BCD66753.1 HTH-type transcriptional regulator, bacterioopsin transcriptional activator and related proteins [Nitratiruptor sp. YY08-26]
MQQYVPFLLVVLDEMGNIVEFHNEIEGLGYDEEEVIGKNWFDTFINPNDRQKVFHVFCEIIAGNDKNYETYNNDILCKNGTHKFIDFYNKLITKNGKKYTFSVGLEHIHYNPLLLRELGEFIFKNANFLP